jgi:hypothetical protein
MYSGEFDISQPALSFISWLVFFLASHNFPLDQRSAYFGTHHFYHADLRTLLWGGCNDFSRGLVNKTYPRTSREDG